MQEDIITRIYHHAEALEYQSVNLPEELGGLALVLKLLGQDLLKCGEELDEKYPKKTEIPPEMMP